MDIETFKKAGVRFDHSRFAVVPEIPYVQDVLYALRLSDAQKYYDICLANHPTYVVNVGLVIAATGYAVLCMERFDESEARKIIAQAILELTRPEDRCLFNPALIEAEEAITGKPAPSRTADREKTIAACGCAGCKKIVRDRHDASAYGM
jgi:hypothetical protein